jgi:hypothetical protein
VHSVLVLGFSDSSPKNKHWARYAGLFSCAEVNLMEKQLLYLLDYDLRMTEDDLLIHFEPFLPKKPSSSTVSTPNSVPSTPTKLSKSKSSLSITVPGSGRVRDVVAQSPVWPITPKKNLALAGANGSPTPVGKGGGVKSSEVTGNPITPLKHRFTRGDGNTLSINRNEISQIQIPRPLPSAGSDSNSSSSSSSDSSILPPITPSSATSNSDDEKVETPISINAAEDYSEESVETMEGIEEGGGQVMMMNNDPSKVFGIATTTTYQHSVRKHSPKGLAAKRYAGGVVPALNSSKNSLTSSRLNLSERVLMEKAQGISMKTTVSSESSSSSVSGGLITPTDEVFQLNLGGEDAEMGANGVGSANGNGGKVLGMGGKTGSFLRLMGIGGGVHRN